jgi:CRP-like cAMP-binding protein
MNSSIHPPRTACGGPRRFEALRTLAVTTLYCRGQEICSQGEPADHWFWIIAGSARGSVIRSDGRRQIVDLLLPDDCFGFTNGAEYDDTVEAVVADTYAGSCSRRDAEAVADSNRHNGPRHGAPKGRRLFARNVGPHVEPVQRRPRPPHVALRHRRLSRALGRDREPFADASEGARGDQAYRAPFGADPGARRAGGRSRRAARRRPGSA